MYYTTIIAFCLLFISPILSLPFILWDIYKQHKGGLVLFAIFMALIAFLTPPVSDLYRHTRDYFNMYQYSSLHTYFKSLGDDFVVQTIAYVFYHNGIKYPIARFFYTFIENIFLFSIFFDVAHGRYTNKRYFSLFILLFCSFNFYAFVLGVRHGFAMSFFIAGYYLLYEKKIALGILLLLIAPCIHFFYMSLSLFVVFFYCVKIEISNRIFYILAVMAIVFGFVLSSFFIHRLFASHTSYIDGQWGTAYQDNASTKGVAYYFIKRTWWFPVLLFFLKNKLKSCSTRNVVYSLLLMFLLTSSMATISGRIVDVLVLFLIFYYIENSEFATPKLHRCILLCSIFFLFCNFYTNRKMLINFDITSYKEMYKPLTIILGHDYPKDWTYSHIDKDGSIKNRYINE